MSTNTLKTYGAVSRFNHWVTAIVMIGMIAFGLYMEDLPKETRAALMGIHKGIGFLFLFFALWRVGVRITQGFPPALGNMPHWQETAAKAMHWALLAAILIMPISGVLMSLYSDHAINVFGLFTIPAQGKVEAISGPAHLMHGLGGNILIALIILHVAAALKHHIIDKDATLARMTGRATKDLAA